LNIAEQRLSRKRFRATNRAISEVLMTELEALRQEIAALRREVAELRGQGVNHHHHYPQQPLRLHPGYYPPAYPSPGTPYLVGPPATCFSAGGGAVAVNGN
jgi:hypothetical protein